MKELIQKNGIKYFIYITLALLYLAAICFDHPQQLASGLRSIILSRDALITDYFELVGYGPAFLNAALVMTLSLVMIEYAELPYTGLTVAAVFINTGFGFWGKNMVNILPIHFGTILYAKAHNTPMSRYTYTALFATCLAPFVTELTYILPFGLWGNLAIAILAGLFVGYVLPPLSQHTASMHMGYSLFNVGFSGGTLAFVLFCVLKSFGIASEPVFIWKAERHPGMVIGIYVYLAAAFFVIGIAPIAGQFGPIWGIVAGMMHSSIVMCTSSMYGGLNLYNNGFSCGWVAIVMLPIIESFMHGYQIRKQIRKQKRENRKENRDNDS